MKNGVTIEGGGEFAQDSRHDLQDRRLQKALADVHGHRPSKVSCLCRAHEGIFLPMEVFPSGDPDFPWRIDRRRISDPHDVDCIYTFVDDEVRSERAKPSTGILDPRQGPLSGLLARSEISGGGETRGPRAETYTGFMGGAFARGYTLAWSRANGLVWPSRNPTATETFGAIAEVLFSTEFTDARNVFEGAARKGVTIVFGIWDQPLQPHSTVRRIVSLLRFEPTRQKFVRAFVSINPDVEVWAARQVQIFDHFIVPPYFFAAVVTPDGVVRKIFFRPVYFDGVDLFPVDSQGERGVGCDFLNEEKIIYKPPGTMEHYERLPLAQQLLLGVRRRWPHEPDYLVYEALQSGEICEVVGFDESNLSYHRHLAAKGVCYRQLIAGTAVRYDDQRWARNYTSVARSGVRPEFSISGSVQILPRLWIPR